MEIRTSEEARKNIEDFSKALMDKLLEKKRLDEEIKELKEEYKEEGVPVGIVSKVLNSIKAEKKKSDSELFEEDQIKEWLQTNQQIDDMIGLIISK